MKLLEYFHGLRSPIIENFGISFKHEFIKIEGRRLVAPILTYEGSKTKSVFNGKWSMGNSKFLEAPTPTKMNWAFLNLDSTINEPTSKKCASELVEIAKNQGLYLNDNPIYMISKESIDNDLKEIKSKNCKFALIILPDNGEFTYWKIKQVAELEAGVVTQVITSNTIKNRWVASTINHVLLKLNSKLNGINHKISPESNVQLIYKNYVMFVGADVTHPTPQDKGTPSVVGVVSSTDNSGCKYNMGHSYQKGRKEIIDDFKNIMIKHIRLYAKKNKGIPPTHIIYYRDGIDDGQFDLVINEELNKGMNQAFGEIAIQIKKPYNPKVTCIVVQKRNHTRFFPLEGGPSFGKMMNVFPGTVVDKVICHPKRKEFFLVSHESGLGTVKPTKYIVIRDDSNISMDDIHKITHNMCHLFPRCNREVSYPAPAYLAHHAASRGKAYIQDLKNFDLDDLNKNTIVSEDIMENNPMFFI
uniref:Piwi domain-containing protein n=1 Tax=Megaselia scalaris TaxID=36166 RepID=T1GXV0_MEGSC